MATWNRDDIIRWILDRDSRRLPLNISAVREADGCVCRAAIEAFGSWECAVSAAGIHIAKEPRRWTNRWIVAIIRRIGKRPEALRYSKIYRTQRSLYQTAKSRFGSWRQALIAAGFDPDEIRVIPRWDRNAVIEAILLRAVKNLPLGTSSVRPHGLRSAGTAIFGSWPAALEAAGLSPERFIGRRASATNPLETQPPVAAAVDPSDQDSQVTPAVTRWTPELIVKAVHRRLQDGKELNDRSVRGQDYRLYRAGVSCFGNWSKTLSAAGLDPDKIKKARFRQPISPMKHAVCESSCEAQPAGTSDDVPAGSLLPGCGKGLANGKTAIGRPEAPESHQSHRRTKWTRETIIQAIQARAARGLPLKKWMVQPYNLGQVATAIFGSWEEALRSAGVDLNRLQNETSQDAQATALQVTEGGADDSDWSSVGPPWTKEAIMEVIHRRIKANLPVNEAIIRVECGGMYGSAKSKFRSWANAIAAFGLNPDDIRKGPARTDCIPQAKQADAQ